MLLTLDFTAEVPLGKQIAAQIHQAISAGKLCPGERLPSARHLAESVGVNMHTVLSAYGALRNSGLIEMRQGRGTRVRPDVLRPPHEVVMQAIELVDSATDAGMTKADLLRLLESI